MVEVARSYTMKGCIVLAPFVDINGRYMTTSSPDSFEKVKKLLDELHIEKINFASQIVVVMVDNYIGESTQQEISYAAAEGKKIEFRNFPSLKAGPGATYGLPKIVEEPSKIPYYTSGEKDYVPGEDVPETSEESTELGYSGGRVFSNGVQIDPETMKPIGPTASIPPSLEPDSKIPFYKIGE
jgi:hypothetical protein